MRKVVTCCMVMTALLAGCVKNEDMAEKIAMEGIQQKLAYLSFESFKIDKLEIEKDNTVMTRYKFIGTVTLKGGKEIKNASATAQRNKTSGEPKWTFGGCNCSQIYEAYQQERGVARD